MFKDRRRFDDWRRKIDTVHALGWRACAFSAVLVEEGASTVHRDADLVFCDRWRAGARFTLVRQADTNIAVRLTILERSIIFHTLIVCRRRATNRFALPSITIITLAREAVELEGVDAEAVAACLEDRRRRSWRIDAVQALGGNARALSSVRMNERGGSVLLYALQVRRLRSRWRPCAESSTIGKAYADLAVILLPLERSVLFHTFLILCHRVVVSIAFPAILRFALAREFQEIVFGAAEFADAFLHDSGLSHDGARSGNDNCLGAAGECVEIGHSDCFRESDRVGTAAVAVVVLCADIFAAFDERSLVPSRQGQEHRKGEQETHW